jgi:peroxiredoxin
VVGRLDDFRSIGATVLVVSQASSEVLAAHLKEEPQPVEVLADPKRDAYRYFGLERASWWTVAGLRSLLGYLRLMVRGWWPRLPHKGEDVLQLGGDFILDADRRLVYAYQSIRPTDRPPVDELLRVMRRPRA